MNKTILMGRLTEETEVKYLQDENSTAMARYTLAVNRRYRKDGKAETDFISCVTFGKNAEFRRKISEKRFEDFSRADGVQDWKLCESGGE